MNVSPNKLELIMPNVSILIRLYVTCYLLFTCKPFEYLLVTMVTGQESVWWGRSATKIKGWPELAQYQQPQPGKQTNKH